VADSPGTRLRNFNRQRCGDPRGHNVRIARPPLMRGVGVRNRPKNLPGAVPYNNPLTFPQPLTDNQRRAALLP
jgi:hypothetical protein